MKGQYFSSNTLLGGLHYRLPSAPTGVVATYTDTSDTAITVDWVAPTDTGVGPILQYEVTCTHTGANPPSSRTEVYPGTQTTTGVNGFGGSDSLDNFAPYTCTVRYSLLRFPVTSPLHWLPLIV